MPNNNRIGPGQLKIKTTARLRRSEGISFSRRAWWAGAAVAGLASAVALGVGSPEAVKLLWPAPQKPVIEAARAPMAFIPQDRLGTVIGAQVVPLRLTVREAAPAVVVTAVVSTPEVAAPPAPVAAYPARQPSPRYDLAEADRTVAPVQTPILMAATPEGTLTPTGVMVYLGRPVVVPPERPGTTLTAADLIPMQPDAWPRPRARTWQAGAETAGMLAGGEPQLVRAAWRRPQPRPDDLRAAVVTPDPSEETVMLTASRVAPAQPVEQAVVPDAPAGSAFPVDGTACPARLTHNIPKRARTALPGSQVIAQLDALGGTERDQLIARELLAGNLPDFLRHLTPVAFTGTDSAGRVLHVTVCVTPDYLAFGSDADFVRAPMGLPTAAQIADRFGFMLPTTRIVDAVYAQAGLQLAPQPMQAGPQMSSTRYFGQHNATVRDQGRASGLRAGELVAGQKKDLVLSNRLRSAPGRVAIYGWHQAIGHPIQPLSTVHGAQYADYSHGVRLVSQTAFVNGRPVALSEVLENPAYEGILSNEGLIRQPELLMASLYRH